jgi:solute carrier family 35 protein
MNPEVLAKLSAAGMYGAASVLIMFVNKFALTVYGFPSFTALGLAQCVATVAAVYLMKLFRVIKFPDFDPSVIQKLFPLPIFFILNLLSGLGGTKRINVSRSRAAVVCDRLPLS